MASMFRPDCYSGLDAGRLDAGRLDVDGRVGIGPCWVSAQKAERPSVRTCRRYGRPGARPVGPVFFRLWARPVGDVLEQSPPLSGMEEMSPFLQRRLRWLGACSEPSQASLGIHCQFELGHKNCSRKKRAPKPPVRPPVRLTAHGSRNTRTAQGPRLLHRIDRVGHPLHPGCLGFGPLRAAKRERSADAKRRAKR